MVLTDRRGRWLLPSDWQFAGDFYWTYLQNIPHSHGFSGLCFRVFAVTSTKSSRPAPTHKSPASCPRMYICLACLYCLLLAPPVHPPGSLPTRPLLSTTVFAARPTPRRLPADDANNKRGRVIHVRTCAKEVPLPLVVIRQPEPKKGEAAAAWCLTVASRRRRRRSLSHRIAPIWPNSPQGFYFYFNTAILS